MYARILVPVDNSKHSDEAVRLAAALAGALGATVVGFHAYAARLHETRFRQMEPALPGPYGGPAELRNSRAVHVTLISDGLRMISDSYLDHAEELCRRRGAVFERRLAEGANYVEILREIGRDGCDLVALGALGLGARRRSLIGSVGERVLRRSPIDVLLVRKPPPGSRGVIALSDGSTPAARAVDTALRLGDALGEPVEVVSVFDPQFHIAAFKSISGVLSEEAAERFRFDEQRRLHEEIIDGGLEKLYRGYLATAERMAADARQQVETTLLKGKPFQRILDYADERRPRLLVAGRFGRHRTEHADLGSTTENVARLAASCVLVVAGEIAPPDDRLTWAPDAEARLQQVPPGTMRELTRQRVEVLASRLGRTHVTLDVIEEKYGEWAEGSARRTSGLRWSPNARNRIERIPPFVRGMAVEAIEAYAVQLGRDEVTPELIDQARRHWAETGRFHRP